jgi:hypothetical protein
MTALTPEEAITAFATRAWQGPVIGINLLKFRAQAQYPNGSFEPCTGQEAWLRYEKLALKVAEKYHLEPMVRATVEQNIFCAYDEQWDALIINGYRSKTDLVGALADPELAELGVHVGAAVENYTFIACRPDNI